MCHHRKRRPLNDRKNIAKGVRQLQEGKIRRKKRGLHLEKMNLTHPQKEAVKLLVQAQRNKFKKLLHETHERMHVIAAHQYGLDLWLGLSGKYEFVSPSCEQLTGYARTEFIQKRITFEQMVHPDHLERFRVDKQLALDGVGSLDVEYRWIRKDGAVRWARATWSPVYTRRDKHVGTRLSIRDITTEKRMAMECDAARMLLARMASQGGVICPLKRPGHVEIGPLVRAGMWPAKAGTSAEIDVASLVDAATLPAVRTALDAVVADGVASECDARLVPTASWRDVHLSFIRLDAGDADSALFLHITPTA